MASKRVIVTGGAGFIGSHTCHLLLHEDVDVLALDNLATGHLKNMDAFRDHPHFQFEEMDVAHGDHLCAVTAKFKPDAIIHLAALVSVQESIINPALNFERNIFATHCVTEAARQSQVARIVFASSAAVFGDNTDLPLNECSKKRPLSPYGAAKLASENLLMGATSTYGFSAIANRYFNVYGPRQDPKSPYSGVMSIFLDRFRNDKAVTVFGDGQQTRDFIYVGDIAKMNVIAALTDQLKGFNAFNICTGRSTSLLELIEAFRKFFPSTSDTQFSEARKGDIIHSLGDPKTARSVVGFTAETELVEGLSHYLRAEGIQI